MWWQKSTWPNSGQFSNQLPVCRLYLKRWTDRSEFIPIRNFYCFPFGTFYCPIRCSLLLCPPRLLACDRFGIGKVLGRFFGLSSTRLGTTRPELHTEQFFFSFCLWTTKDFIDRDLFIKTRLSKYLPNNKRSTIFELSPRNLIKMTTLWGGPFDQVSWW